MKTEELLSKSTITSSRTLTIYSATVLAIFLTQTDLKELPGIGSLQGKETTRYGLVMAVLVFMIVVHNVNFWSDVYGAKAEHATKSFQGLKNALRNLKAPTRNTASAEQSLNEFSERVAHQRAVSERLNWFAREGLHIIAPMLLAVPACVVLAWKVYTLISAGE